MAPAALGAALSLLLLVRFAQAEPVVVLPAEGAQLTRVHVSFRWAPLEGAASYQLEVVEDRGAADPFDGAERVVALSLDAAEPRTLVTQGLAFGKAYAWRAGARLPEQFSWGPSHHFSILPYPELMPRFAVTRGHAAGPLEPGLTLFLQTGFVAVDALGSPVWFLLRRSMHDIRLLPNGRISFISFGRGGKEPGRAYETTLDGSDLWLSPDDPDLFVHHEVSRMPDGNPLALVREYREVERDGSPQRWLGDRIVEFDRRSGEVVWSWSTFDHYSTLDFDVEDMREPLEDGSYDWTHANSVVYNPADDSVYISVRQLSRITRIDYASGDVVYNMGQQMPSGDVAFGDGLFSFQHSLELLPNGNMIVYDNGNRRRPPESPRFTRAIELGFSGGEPPTSASLVWEYRLPEYNPTGGDADRLPGGNTLVVSGGNPHLVHDGTLVDQAALARLNALGYLAAAGPAAGGAEAGSQPHRIYEVDPSGGVVWRLDVVDPPSHPIYRAERVPRLVVDTPGDSDGDWDVDHADSEALRSCLNAPRAKQAGFPCSLSDLDSDGDVDCADGEALRSVWTGRGSPPDLDACEAALPVGWTGRERWAVLAALAVALAAGFRSVRPHRHPESHGGAEIGSSRSGIQRSGAGRRPQRVTLQADHPARAARRNRRT